VPFLNGFGHLQQIENQLPQATVYGGVAQIPATLTADGTVKHLSPQHGMIMGPRQGQAASRSKADEFVSLAKKSGIDASVSDTIEHEMWEKWVFLTALAAGTSLARSNLGEILKTDRGEAFLLGLLDECTTVAAREGFRPSDERTRRYRAHFGDRTSTLTASMTRDMEHGKPIEGDHIIGDMLRRARKHDVSTPYLDAAWVCLQCYEALHRQAIAQ
jgi:2-dehydropantoate 2-reductase